MKKRLTIYGRLITMTLAALIGTFVTPIAVLVFSGGISSEEISTYALGGAIGFAVLGFLFPKPMEKILFVLTLFG